MKEIFFDIFPCYFIAVNLLAFLLYGIDKFKAKRGLWRIGEKTLLGISLLGGFVGAFCGIKIFKHKTRHWYFYLTTAVSLVLWASLLYLSGYFKT